MDVKSLIAVVAGMGLSLLAAGVLAWSPFLVSAGSGILMTGVVAYAALRSEEELRRISSEVEARFYRELVKLVLEEFELYEDRAVFFTPGRGGNSPSVLVSHKKFKPPQKPPKRLFFEYGGGYFIRLPSMLSLFETSIPRTSNMAELESTLYAALRELGLVSEVKAVERPDGILVVEVSPKRGVVLEEEPYDVVVNLVGSIMAEGLKNPLILRKFERNEKVYVLHFERIV